MIQQRTESESVHSVLTDVLEELTNKFNAGESIDFDSYEKLYPAHIQEIRGLVSALESMAQFDVEAESTSATRLHTLGDFQIVREIGRGGMGIVYEAEQISLGRPVALKVLPFASVLDRRQLARFKNEAQAAGALHHTNIVPVFGTGCERGVHYYAMQYIEGTTLADVIRDLRLREGLDEAGTDSNGAAHSGNSLSAESSREGMGDLTHDWSSHALPRRRPKAYQKTSETKRELQAVISTYQSSKTSSYCRSIAELGVQAAEALSYAHEEGVIHRDIKPSNLILDDRTKLWITDFGLAHVDSNTELTMSGDLVGTLRYMSPEQAMAKRVVVDERTDIYSLGVTLYELLTLRPAYTGGDRQELLRQIAFEEPRRARKLNQQIPQELETIVLKTMEKNPGDRYATARELADDLRRFLQDKPIRARRPSLFQHVTKWCRRHKSLVVAAVIALVVGMMGLAVANSQLARERNRAIAQRMETERELRVSTSLRLAARSQSIQEQLPLQSLLLGVEAIETTRRHQEPIHPIAEESLRDALASVGGMRLLPTSGHVSSAFSADGKTMVTNHDEEVRLWDVTKPWNYKVVARIEAEHSVRGISSDQRWMVVTDEREGLQLWDLNSSDPRRDLNGYEGDYFGPTRFSRDNRWLVVGIHNKVFVWDLSARTIDNPVYTLDAHDPDRNIWDLQISPDSRWIASEAADATTRVWDLTARDPAHSGFTFGVGESEGNARSITFSPNSRWLAVGAGAYGKPDNSSSVRLWDLSAPDPVASPTVLAGHHGEIDAVAFSPDNRWLVSAGAGRLIRWDLQSPQPTTSATLLIGHEDQVRAVAFSPDGSWLVTGSFDKTARLWDVSAPNPSSTAIVLRGHDSVLEDTAFTADGNWIVTRGRESATRIWDISTLRRRKNTQLGTNPLVWNHSGERIRLVRFLRDGSRLLSASFGENGVRGEVQVHDFSSSGSQAHSSQRVFSRDNVAVATLSDDSRSLAVGTSDGMLEVWDLEATGSVTSPRASLDLGKRLVSAVFGSRGHLLATADQDRYVRLTDLQSEPPKTLVLLPGEPAQGNRSWLRVAFSPDRRWLAASLGTTARLWNLANDDPLAAQPLVSRVHDEDIRHLAFSPDSRWLATGSEDGTTRLWDMTAVNTTTPFVLRGHRYFVSNLAFSPDSRWLATSSYRARTYPFEFDPLVLLWDLTQPPDQLSAKPFLFSDQELIGRQPFSPDSSHLVTVDMTGLSDQKARRRAADRDRLLRLWDLTTEDPSSRSTNSLFGFVGSWPHLARFGVDGQRLIAGGGYVSGTGSGAETRIWDLQNPTKRSVALPSSDVLLTMTLSSDGRYLAAGTRDSAVYVWDLNIDSLIQAARRVAGRELTAIERRRYLLD